jgi:hypothetical protein
VVLGLVHRALPPLDLVGLQVAIMIAQVFVKPADLERVLDSKRRGA